MNEGLPVQEQQPASNPLRSIEEPTERASARLEDMAKLLQKIDDLKKRLEESDLSDEQKQDRLLMQLAKEGIPAEEAEADMRALEDAIRDPSTAARLLPKLKGTNMGNSALYTIVGSYEELAKTDPIAACEALEQVVAPAGLEKEEVLLAQTTLKRAFSRTRELNLHKAIKVDVFQAVKDWQNDALWKEIDPVGHERMLGICRNGFEKRLSGATDEADYADVLRRIPEGFLPRAASLVNAAFRLQGSRMHQAERSKHVLDLLKDHPRALVESGSLVHGIVFTNADRGEVFDRIVQKDEKDPLLGKFFPSYLPKEMRERAAAIIFEQRLVQNPASIIGEFESFKSQFDKLSDDEKSRILHSAMEFDPWAIIHHAHVVRELGYEHVLQHAIFSCALLDFRVVEGYADELAKLSPEQQRELADVWMMGKGLEKKKMPLFAQASWASAIEKLEHLQAHASNNDHDPWMTDLKPLLHGAQWENVVNTKNEADGEIMVEYVKQYGMLNMPITFRWHVALSRVKSIEDLKPEVRRDISVFLGKPIEKLSNKGFVAQEIKRMVAELRNKLLDGTLTSEILSRHPACEEMISAAIGTTVWTGGGRKLVDLQKAWEKNIANDPEQARTPEGYETVRFDVAEVERSESRSSDEKREKIENNPDVQTQMVKWVGAMVLAESRKRVGIESDTNPDEEWVRAEKGFVDDLLTNELEDLLKKAPANEKARLGLEKKRQELELAVNSVYGLLFEEYGEVRSFEEILARLVAWPKSIQCKNELLRLFSTRHMLGLMSPEHMNVLHDEVGDEYDVGEGNVTYDLQKWSSFMLGYVNEHYLNEKQQPEHTGHPPFDAKTLEALRYAWGMAKPETNPVIDAAKRLRELNMGTMTGRTKTVDLIPVTGLMRITAGDAGDACYTSKHDALAEGDYPDLHAFVFVTGRGTPQERIQGSVLAIETEDDDGTSTLVVRANNPRMSLLSAVDPAELVAKTLDAMKATAKRRGIEQVGVPLDQPTESCSNREDVGAQYWSRYEKAPVLGLRRQPETEFNGYDNWNSKGAHPVVRI